MGHAHYGQAMKELFGEDVESLLIEQLQSDEESTDSEMGEVEKSAKLRIIRPSWRSRKVKKKKGSKINKLKIFFKTSVWMLSKK
jgi:hypothetical protein